MRAAILLCILYGFFLFTLKRVLGQTASLPTWYFGNAIRFQRFTDSECVNLPSTSGNNYGWFGGLNTFTVKLTGLDCLKVPSRVLNDPANTWIQFRFPRMSQFLTCTPASWPTYPNFEIWFFTNPTCMGPFASSRTLYPPSNDFELLRDTNKCLYDRGDGSDPQFYKVFCDVPYPNSTTTVNTFTATTVTNNITNTVLVPLNYTELTPFIRNIVRQELPPPVPLPVPSPPPPLPPPPPPVTVPPPVLNQTELSLMVRTMVLKTLAENGFNASSPSTSLNSSLLTAPPNKAPNSGATGGAFPVDPGLLILCGVPLLFFFSPV